VPLFSYKAVNREGKPEKGSLQAASEKEALAQLRERGIYPLKMNLSRGSPFGWNVPIRLGSRDRLPARELASFCRQLAILLNATIPYDKAVSMIQKEAPRESFRTVLEQVRGRVVEGAFLADAFGAHPKLFPAMMVNMIRSGEASGTLVHVLERLSDYFENINKLRNKLVSALVYPLFMMVFATGVVVFMTTYIIPKITRLFENFGAQLPLPTRLLITVSDLLVNWWWLIIILIVALVVVTVRYVRTPRGKARLDRLELRLPFWKVMRQKVLLQRLSQTLGTMLKSGVDLNDALRVSSEVLENKVYLDGMDDVIFNVQNRGMPLAVALRRTNLFPDDFCQMVAIGEETATLDQMLENIAGRLDNEVTATMDAATSLFEPILIMVVGSVVGFIVMSVMLPMLQLNQLVR